MPLALSFRDHGGIVRSPESRRVAGVDDGGSGEDAVLVGSGYGDSLFFPMHEVAGYGVPPRHVPPIRPLRVVLVEKVVLALVVDEPVGIVHPVALGRVVGEGAPRVVCVHGRGDDGGVCGGLGACGLRVGRGGSPRRRRRARPVRRPLGLAGLYPGRRCRGSGTGGALA